LSKFAFSRALALGNSSLAISFERAALVAFSPYFIAQCSADSFQKLATPKSPPALLNLLFGKPNPIARTKAYQL
jgi:hypothetical protein